MELFRLRFRLDHPAVFAGATPVTLPKGFDVETIQRMSRVEFFNALVPLFKPQRPVRRIDHSDIPKGESSMLLPFERGEEEGESY
jgi:hypothetical protein